MRLFARKSAEPAIAPKATPTDFRASRRSRVGHEAPGCEVEIDGLRMRVRDIGEGGVGVEIDEAMAPRRGMMTLLRGGHPVRRVYAIRAWGRGGRVGYQFVNDLCMAPGISAAAETDLRARGLRRRLEAEVSRRRQPAAETARGPARRAAPEPDEDGRLSGAALRARLRM